ncbi:unnamed protein product [Ilex paraguariensis]|uniref:Uncharacterized protein n=1 Tax=Ilex paraguariensis TaxID=185542 RepID=A0ABC8UVS3_9AQUA
MTSRIRGRGGREEGCIEQASQVEQSTLESRPSEPRQVETSGKRGRGKTRGITFAKKRRAEEKPEVYIPPKLMRAVSNNAQQLITELGIIVRQMAPLQFPKWKAIPIDDKKKMWYASKQKFTLKEDPCIEEAIYQQLNRQYRDHRHRLHKNYYCKYANDEIRLQNCPPDVSPNCWATHWLFWICGLQGFDERTYMEMIMFDIPLNQVIADITEYEFEVVVGIPSWMFRIVSQSDLKRLEAQSMEEGATPMAKDQRFEAVLGPEKSGYIRGRGAGPKPTTSTVGQCIRAQLEKENEELKRQVETNRMRWRRKTVIWLLD